MCRQLEKNLISSLDDFSFSVYALSDNVLQTIPAMVKLVYLIETFNLLRFGTSSNRDITQSRCDLGREQMIRLC